MAKAGAVAWTRDRYVRRTQGHEPMRTVEVAAVGELTSWDSFVEAASDYGVAEASPWVALVRGVEPKECALRDCWASVSTRRFAGG